MKKMFIIISLVLVTVGLANGYYISEVDFITIDGEIVACAKMTIRRISDQTRVF